MKITNKAYKGILSLLPVFMLAGCTIMPGSTVSTFSKDKPEVEDADFSIDERVDVYPMTPSLIDRMTPKVVQSRANPGLDIEKNSYQYRVGIGDVLRITVYNHPELTNPQGEYRSAKDSGNTVRNDGNIFFPYVGNVKVVGMTVDQIRKILSDRLVKYIESPQIDVSVAGFSSHKIYVSGAVKTSGKQALTDIPTTIIDAVNTAGGLTSEADWDHAVLTHKDKSETISLRSLLQKGDLMQNRIMYSGDSLYVPRNDELKVTVMGETISQDTLKMGMYGMTLAEAINNTGGLSRSHSDATGVFVIRPTGTMKGKIARIYQLDASDASAMVMASQFQLEPKDVVYITTAPITRWNRVITKITPQISALNDVISTTRSIRTWP